MKSIRRCTQTEIHALTPFALSSSQLALRLHKTHGSVVLCMCEVMSTWFKNCNATVYYIMNNKIKDDIALYDNIT